MTIFRFTGGTHRGEGKEEEEKGQETKGAGR
jgi:hypothetical protein